MVTWWATTVECASGLARLERDGALDRRGMAQALERLRLAASGWAEVPATPPVREQAIRLVRNHPLRAADAIQLAAAIVASDFQPSALEFVTLDGRQAAAADREGFRVLPEAPA
ncbi:MAG TPA: PIN domain-containing protein [Planctomycetota bacterium]|nr:PIN domain-containing protein [Planctomycetota bacterium]